MQQSIYHSDSICIEWSVTMLHNEHWEIFLFMWCFLEPEPLVKFYRIVIWYSDWENGKGNTRGGVFFLNVGSLWFRVKRHRFPKTYCCYFPLPPLLSIVRYLSNNALSYMFLCHCCSWLGLFGHTTWYICSCSSNRIILFLFPCSPCRPEPRRALWVGGHPQEEGHTPAGDPKAQGGAKRGDFRGRRTGDQHRGQVKRVCTLGL